jgi:hypothetical protein
MATAAATDMGPARVNTIAEIAGTITARKLGTPISVVISSSSSLHASTGDAIDDDIDDRIAEGRRIDAQPAQLIERTQLRQRPGIALHQLAQTMQHSLRGRLPDASPSLDCSKPAGRVPR